MEKIKEFLRVFWKKTLNLLPVLLGALILIVGGCLVSGAIFLAYRALIVVKFLPWIIVALFLVFLSLFLNNKINIYRKWIIAVFAITAILAILSFLSFVAQPFTLLVFVFLNFILFFLKLKEEAIKKYFKYYRRKKRILRQLESIKFKPTGETNSKTEFVFIGNLGNRQLIETVIDPEVHGISSGVFLKRKDSDGVSYLISVCVGIGSETYPKREKDCKYLWILEERDSGICRGSTDKFEDLKNFFEFSLL